MKTEHKQRAATAAVIVVALLVTMSILGVMIAQRSPAPSSQDEPLTVSLNGTEYTGQDNEATFAIPTGSRTLRFDTSVTPDSVRVVRNEAAGDFYFSIDTEDGPEVHYFSEIDDLTEYFDPTIGEKYFELRFFSVLASQGQKGIVYVQSIVKKHFAPKTILGFSSHSNAAFYTLIVTSKQNEVRIDFEIN